MCIRDSNNGYGWITLPKGGEPNWDWMLMDYRIKEQDYSLNIPWELIEDEWKYAAMWSGGVVYLYTGRPELRTNYWGLAGGDTATSGFLILKKPDVKHWDQTLTKRPEGK